MSKQIQRGAEFWAAVVAEAQAGAESQTAIAAKHGVTEAALKYHFYKRKTTRAGEAGDRAASARRRGSALDLGRAWGLGGSLRLRSAEGCDPAYVTALVAKLR